MPCLYISANKLCMYVCTRAYNLELTSCILYFSENPGLTGRSHYLERFQHQNNNRGRQVEVEDEAESASPSPDPLLSCQRRCGIPGRDTNLPCQCNAACRDFSDCCADFEEVCQTCRGRCFSRYSPSAPCQCNSQCYKNNNCCQDFEKCAKGILVKFILYFKLKAISSILLLRRFLVRGITNT